MKRSEKLAFLQELKANGIYFLGGIEVPGGGREFSLQPDDILEFTDDKIVWFSKSQGVAVEDYFDWIASEGTPRCGHIKEDGQRCKNHVSGGIQRELHDWLNQEAGFCVRHGGESSKVAKQSRWNHK